MALQDRPARAPKRSRICSFLPERPTRVAMNRILFLLACLSLLWASPAAAPEGDEPNV